MSKVVPVPVSPGLGWDWDQNFFLTRTGTRTEFFLTRTSTKNFSEQDRDQNVFLDQDRDQNIFDWDRHQNLFLKGSGPRPKTFSRRDRDKIFFSSGPGPGRNFFSHRDRDQKWLVPLMPILEQILKIGEFVWWFSVG